jgi:hypothetical protein
VFHNNGLSVLEITSFHLVSGITEYSSPIQSNKESLVCILLVSLVEAFKARVEIRKALHRSTSIFVGAL